MSFFQSGKSKEKNEERNGKALGKIEKQQRIFAKLWKVRKMQLNWKSTISVFQRKNYSSRNEFKN